MTPRRILMVGGCADRQVVDLLRGNDIVMANHRTGHREHYAIVKVQDGEERFEVAVPQEHAAGPWLLRHLLEEYAGRPLP